MPKGVEETKLLESPRGLEEATLLEGDQAFTKSIPGCFGSIAYADFIVDVAHVAADSSLSDDQLIANFPVAFAQGH